MQYLTLLQRRSLLIERQWLILLTCRLVHLFVYVCVCRSVCLSVCRSVRKVYCGKMADWIRMSFGVVSGVGRGMDVLDGVVIVEGEGEIWG